MTITQIQYLLDAVQGHSIHRTAEKYNISPQGASKAIKTLEQELGVTLIERSTKGVYWTELGARCEPLFADILECYEQVQMICYEAKSERAPKTVKGSLSLTVTPRFADAYLGKMLSRLHFPYPGIKLRVDSRSNDKIIARVREAEDDSTLGIISVLNMSPHVERVEAYFQSQSLRFVPVATRKLYMVATKKTLRKLGDVFEIDEPLQVPVVGYEYGGIMDAWYASNEYQLDSIATQLEMINHHDMAGAYSIEEFQMYFDEKKHGYIPFDRDVVLTYGYLLREDHVLTEAEEIFVTFFSTFLTDDRGK